MKTLKVKEAKQKVCPFMTRPTPSTHHTNPNGIVFNINCICGYYMAWEFTKEVEYEDIIETSITRSSLVEDTSSLTNKHIMIAKDTQHSYINTKYGIPKKLEQDKKEGFCRRLVSINNF